jgi:magnesium-protoporphyrin IX monomethyl ester (oxidative) cyclase
VRTQSVLDRKHLGARAVVKTFGIIGRNLRRGQTNFPRMLWRFDRVYNADRQYGEHQRPVRYELPPPVHRTIERGNRRELYVHGR